ncbi:hypothetical protein [Streptomyces sp. NPDC051569]|uniref:hypothetical protein n=1 Tax=Streptomyces sp. NPDC051569 TaxID=3365661 RepID=UPI0037BA2687
MRTYLSMALIVLLAVLTPLSAIAAWTDLEIGNTDRFVSDLAPLASDPEVRDAVSERITDEVIAHVDVGPLQEGVRGLLREAVRSFTTTDTFKAAWTMASRAAHGAVEQVLDTGDGRPVTIDLAHATQQVKKQLTDDGVPFAARIPVRHTDVVILEPNALGVWREVTQGLRTAGIWPAVGAVAVTALALLVAVRRRRALIGVGVAYAAGAVLLIIAVVVGRTSVLNGLPDDGDRAAAGAVYDALTDSLRATGWSVLVAGVVLAMAAWLAGRPRRRGWSPHPAGDGPGTRPAPTGHRPGTG